MAPWQGAQGQAGFYRQIAQMDQKFTDEIEHRYVPLERPVTLRWGEEDQWILPSRGYALAAKLTQGALTLVPGSGVLNSLTTTSLLKRPLERLTNESLVRHTTLLCRTLDRVQQFAR